MFRLRMRINWLLFGALGSFPAQLAQAAEESVDSRHNISAAVGAAVTSVNGYPSMSQIPVWASGGFQLGYAYRIFKSLEIGILARYEHNLSSGPPELFVPCLLYTSDA